jgi:hypothetical protein
MCVAVDGAAGGNFYPQLPDAFAAVTGGTTYMPAWVPTNISSFNPAVAVFSGLSIQTTLTVTVRSYVEYFPTVGHPYMPLCAPSPVLDMKALAAYSIAARAAPYAVPADMNPAGEYFRMVLKILRAVAPSIAGALGNPGVGVFLGSLASVGDSAMELFGPRKPARRYARDMSGAPGMRVRK